MSWKLTAAEKQTLGDIARGALLAETTVTLIRYSAGAPDLEGRVTRTWPEPEPWDTTVRRLPGRIALASIREVRNGSWVSVQQWQARLPVNAGARIGDRLRDEHTGELFEVTGQIVKDTPVGPLYQRCELQRIEGGVL